MQKQVWLNLASKDLKRTKKFYQDLGFEINDAHPNPEMVSIFAGSDRLIINFFPEQTMIQFMKQDLTDKISSNEILFSIGASSVEEVNQLAEQVTKSGGSIFAKPESTGGWMYGFGFTDPDGHRWNSLYMDMSKLPGN